MVCEHFWYMDIIHAKSKMYKYKFKRIKYRWNIKQFKMSHYDDFHAIFSKYFWLMGHRKDNKLQHAPCKPLLYWELLLLSWASEWWRIRLPIQQIQVQSLGQEDPLEEENSNSLQYSCLGNPRQRSLVGYSPWGRRIRHDWATEHARPITSLIFLCIN